MVLVLLPTTSEFANLPSSSSSSWDCRFYFIFRRPLVDSFSSSFLFFLLSFLVSSLLPKHGVLVFFLRHSYTLTLSTWWYTQLSHQEKRLVGWLTGCYFLHHIASHCIALHRLGVWGYFGSKQLQQPQHRRSYFFVFLSFFFAFIGISAGNSKKSHP